MPNVVVLWLALAVACGAAEPPTEERVTPTEGIVVTEEGVAADDDVADDDVADDDVADDDVADDDVADDEEVMRCTSDDDCVLGGPPQCCASGGPNCAQAWSRVAWESFRAQCAVLDCERDVMLACPEREGPPPTAACVDARCVLR